MIAFALVQISLRCCQFLSELSFTKATKMSVFVDGAGDDVRDAYEDVRNDDTESNWALFGYDNDGQGKKIEHKESGSDYEDFVALLGDDQRGYGYVRFEIGDEMSRRKKFAFITWIGPSVSPLKKAKVSTDKAFVKRICVDFGKEILADEKNEVAEKKIRQILELASGAAYGTGK